MNDSKEVGLSVIIPVYNEALALGGFASDLKAFLSKNLSQSELIFVDDGSKDASYEILSNLKDVLVLRHETNRGYGRSLKTGISEAKYERILIMDSDSTYPINRIKDLFDLSLSYDMVVGSRDGDIVHHSLIVKMAKWPINQLANYLVNFKIPDLNSGMRIFKKDVAKKYFNILPDGFSFTTNITLAHLSDGYSVKYLPINYAKRVGKTKVHPIKDAINYFNLVVRMILLYNPLKFFLPLSILFFIFSLLSFYNDIFIKSNLSDKSVIFFISFFQILSIGFVAELINKRSK